MNIAIIILLIYGIFSTGTFSFNGKKIVNCNYFTLAALILFLIKIF